MKCSSNTAAFNGPFRQRISRRRLLSIMMNLRSDLPSAGCSRMDSSTTPMAAHVSSAKSRAIGRNNRATNSLSCCSRGGARQRNGTRKPARPNRRCLRKLYPTEVYVEINPSDAQSLGIRPGDWITVASQRGSLRACAFLTPAVQAGQLFIPMHYDVTNRLTDAVFDPYSHQPAYKACAVRIESQL